MTWSRTSFSNISMPKVLLLDCLALPLQSNFGFGERSAEGFLLCIPMLIVVCFVGSIGCFTQTESSVVGQYRLSPIPQRSHRIRETRIIQFPPFFSSNVTNIRIVSSRAISMYTRGGSFLLFPVFLPTLQQLQVARLLSETAFRSRGKASGQFLENVERISTCQALAFSVFHSVFSRHFSAGPLGNRMRCVP